MGCICHSKCFLFTFEMQFHLSLGVIGAAYLAPTIAYAVGSVVIGPIADKLVWFSYSEWVHYTYQTSISDAAASNYFIIQLVWLLFTSSLSLKAVFNMNWWETWCLIELFGMNRYCYHKGSKGVKSHQTHMVVSVSALPSVINPSCFSSS